MPRKVIKTKATIKSEPVESLTIKLHEWQVIALAVMSLAALLLVMIGIIIFKYNARDLKQAATPIDYTPAIYQKNQQIEKNIHCNRDPLITLPECR